MSLPPLVAWTVGVVAALLTVLIARRFRLSGERVFFALLLCLIAAIYPIWLSNLGAGHLAIRQELVSAAAFVLLAAVGLRYHPGALVVGFVAHALWDFAHHSIPGSAVPAWYLSMCLTYDLTLGIYSGMRLADWRVLQEAS